MDGLVMALRAIRWRVGASVSVLVVAVFATAVAAAGPVYLIAAGDSILQYGLRTAVPTARGTGIEVTGGVSGRPGTDRLAAAVDGSMRGGLLRRAYPRMVVGLEYRTRLLEPTGSTAASTAVVFRQDACAHVRLVAGRCAAEGSVDQAMVTRTTADTLKLAVGATIDVDHFTDPGQGHTDRPMRVVGVFEPVETGGAYWFNDTREYFGTSADRQNQTNPPTVEAVLVPRSAFAAMSLAPAGAMTAVADLTMRREVLHRSGVTALRAQLDAFGTALASAGVNQHGFDGAVVTGLRPVLTRADTGRSTLQVPMLLVVGQLLLIGWYVLFMVAGATAEARAGEVALAKLRGLSPGSTVAFGMLESVLLLLVSVPLGVAVGTVAVRAVAGAVFGPDALVTFPVTAWLSAGVAAAGGLLAVALGAVATFRRPVLAQWRRANRDPGARSSVADAVVVALAVAGLGSLWWGGAFQGDRINVLALAAPGLLALAGALIGARLLPVGVQAGVRATRGSRRIGVFLALRQVRRRPGGLRLVAVLATAFALATFSVLAWSVFAANRHDRAAAETGAARVVTIDPYGQPDVRGLLDRLGGGRDAMAVLNLTSVAAAPNADFGSDEGPSKATMQLLAVPRDRLPGIGFWRPDFGAPTLRQVAGSLAAPVPAPIPVRGDALRLAAVNRPTANLRMDLGAQLIAADGSLVTVALKPTGDGHVAAAVPCLKTACRLTAITVTRALPGLYPAIGVLTVTAVEQHGSGWTPVAGGTDPARWQPANPTVPGLDQPVEKISAGLTISYAAPGTVTRIGAQAVTLARIPAVATTAYAPPPGTRALVLDMPSGAPLDVDAVRTVDVLPRAGDRGVLVDLDELLAARPYGYADLLPNEIWLTAGAPADLPDRLAAAGVAVTGVSTVEQRERVLRHEGPALSVTLMLAGAGAAALLAAAGAVVNLHVMSRRRAFELAAMRSLGVRRISMAAAVGAEQAMVTGYAIVLGVGLGVLGARLALPAIPEYADLPSYPALLIRLPPVLVVAVAAGLALLLGIALLASGYALLRAAVPSRLREAQA
jgi:hypothetical protein